MADGLPESKWKPLQRPAPYQIKTEKRCRPENIKQQIIKRKEFKNIRLDSEQVAEDKRKALGATRASRLPQAIPGSMEIKAITQQHRVRACSTPS